MGEGDASVAVPCKSGSLPVLPRGGVSSAEEAAKLPGARVIPSYSAAAAAGSAYAYVKVNAPANLFRITLP